MLQPLKQACINSPRPIWFTSLSKLFIQITTISDDQVLAMAAIFERTPNLHYLRIRRETDYMSQTNVNAEVLLHYFHSLFLTNTLLYMFDHFLF